jgi:hypothetical protein
VLIGNLNLRESQEETSRNFGKISELAINQDGDVGIGVFPEGEEGLVS